MKFNLLTCATAFVFMACNPSNKTNSEEAKIGIKNEKVSYSIQTFA